MVIQHSMLWGTYILHCYLCRNITITFSLPFNSFHICRRPQESVMICLFSQLVHLQQRPAHLFFYYKYLDLGSLSSYSWLKAWSPGEVTSDLCLSRVWFCQPKSKVIWFMTRVWLGSKSCELEPQLENLLTLADTVRSWLLGRGGAAATLLLTW